MVGTFLSAAGCSRYLGQLEAGCTSLRCLQSPGWKGHTLHLHWDKSEHVWSPDTVCVQRAGSFPCLEGVRSPLWKP